MEGFELVLISGQSFELLLRLNGPDDVRLALMSIEGVIGTGLHE